MGEQGWELHMNERTANLVRRICGEYGKTWEDVCGMTDAELLEHRDVGVVTIENIRAAEKAVADGLRPQGPELSEAEKHRLATYDPRRTYKDLGVAWGVSAGRASQVVWSLREKGYIA